MFLPFMLIKIPFLSFSGIVIPVDKIDLRNASSTEYPKHATSPVDAISTPTTGSAPFSLEKENCAAFTPTNSKSNIDLSILSVVYPKMAFVASSMKLTLNVFEQNGKLRDARRLH